MKSVDVVVATGGGAMVKSAYSSGKPSYGVGAGNVPVIIDRGVDFKDAVDKIVTGAAFDNGIICSHEQFVLTPEEHYDETVKLFKDTGKVWFTDDEKQIQKLREVVFPDGHLNKDVVGQHRRARSARWRASTCRRARGSSCCPRRAPARTTCSRRRSSARSSRSCRTRPSTTPSRRRRRICSSKARATRRRCTRTTRSNIREAGVELPISRLVVNQASSLTAGGSLTNGFAPTTTLGCGSWGGNSISENLDYKHLMNVSRIGKVITNKKVPTDEEIFA